MNQYDSCEDFVADSYFRQWVKQPDEASILYWEAYLAEYPEKAQMVRQAVELVKQLSDASASQTDPVTHDTEDAVWQGVLHQIGHSHRSSFGPFFNLSRNWQNLLAIAASVTVALGLGWWLLIHRSGSAVLKVDQLTRVNHSLIEQTNTTQATKLIALPDGSSIFLKKGSKVAYSRKFDEPNRTVHLTGEAYFEIAKDASRPFLVHAHELSTKVLGTSFTIRAYPNDKDVVVTVRSGRVAVFPQSNRKQSPKTRLATPEEIVLTRNQQIVFARQQARFVRTSRVLATTPLFPKGLSTSLPTFDFNATPISEVFSQLEKVYGVKIIYDKNGLGTCRLTADLTNESLAEKLMIICKSIEAEYRMQQLTVVVSGPGC